jgi:hypothetical protein
VDEAVIVSDRALPAGADAPGQSAFTRARGLGPAILCGCALLAAVLFAAALLSAGCGGTSGGSPGSSGGPAATGTTVSTSGTIALAVGHETGTQGIAISLVVSNQTQQPMMWNGGCVTPYLVILRDAGGHVVQRWPAVQSGVTCHAIAVITLDPGAEHTFAVVQTDDLRSASGAPIPNGAYTVSASFTLQRYRGGGPTTLTASDQLDW